MGFRDQCMWVLDVFSGDRPYMDMILQRVPSAQRWSAVIAAPVSDAAESFKSMLNMVKMEQVAAIPKHFSEIIICS